MKIKLLASSLLMAGALIGSGTASAVSISVFAGTLSNWTTVNDALADGAADSTFTLNSFSGSGSGSGSAAFNGNYIDVSIVEIYNGTTSSHTDVAYDIIFTPNITDILSPYKAAGGYTGTDGVVNYTIASLNNELFSSARLDVDAAGITGNLEIVSKVLSDTNGTFLTLNSSGGLPDPTTPGGHYNFTPRVSVNIVDNWNAHGGLIHSVSNQFDNHVPEPTTIAMMGLGLLGFAASRKKKSGLSAISA